MTQHADYFMKKEQAQQSPKSIAEAYADFIWNKKDLTAINKLLDDNVLIHSLLGDFYGKEAMEKVVKAWLTGFPNLVVSNLSVLGEGDLASIHWQAHGTHLGEFKGIKATGKNVSYAGVTLYRIRDGKIIEYWAYLDMKHLLEEIT